MSPVYDLSLVVVGYHSSAVLKACIDSHRQQAQACGKSLEVVIVDHSQDEQERALLSALAPDQLLLQENRGYAAGLNRGMAAAKGAVVLLANPDVELLPSCLQRLLDGLAEGYTVVAPQLVWDSQGLLFQPIPDDPSWPAALRRAARLRWRRSWWRGVDEQLEASWRTWTASGCCSMRSLRGPLLVLERDSWERLGPMDEGYFLFYEETEWLWRARRRGARFALVGDALALHRWGHSTRQRPGATAREDTSRQRFVKRNYPLLGRWLLWAIGSRGGTVGPPVQEIDSPAALPEADAQLWLLSPYSHFMPAGGWVGGGHPPELETLTGSGRFFAGAARREQGRWQLCNSWSWCA